MRGVEEAVDLDARLGPIARGLLPAALPLLMAQPALAQSGAEAVRTGSSAARVKPKASGLKGPPCNSGCATSSRTALVARTYDEIADRFVEWQDGWEEDSRSWWREQLMSRLHDGARVLELGCGAAQWSIALARRGARPVGLDLSESAIRHGRAVAAAAGVASIFFIIGLSLAASAAIVQLDRKGP